MTWLINQLNRTFHHSAVLCCNIKFRARLKVNSNSKLNKKVVPLPPYAGRRGYRFLLIFSSLLVMDRGSSLIVFLARYKKYKRKTPREISEVS